MKKILFEDACILNAARVLRFFARLLPLGVSLRLAQGAGLLAYGLSKRRRVAYKNLRAAFASEKTPRELKKIARDSFRTLAMSAVELMRIPEMTTQSARRDIRILGVEKFEPYLKSGRGVLFLTGHFGSWELLNIKASLIGFPMVALARTQKHPRSDAYLNALRSSKGSVVVHKGMPIREILRSLKDGKIVGMLSDQDGGRRGRFVNFFGRLSSTPAGVATFSLRTGAPIFPVCIFREGLTRHRIEVEGPLRFPDAALAPEEAERQMLQEYAEIWESKIRRAPGQWLWAHRRWKSTPDRFVIVLSDGKTGHLRQSQAVLEAIRQNRLKAQPVAGRVFEKIIEVKYKSVFSQFCVRLLHGVFGGHFFASAWFFRRALTRDCYRQILHGYADIVISCGSALQPVNLWVKKENGARSCVVMKPVAGRWPDVVLVPAHDKMKPADNVFETDGAVSWWTPEEIGRHAQTLLSRYPAGGPKKKIGLLVGGQTGEFKFDRAAFERMMQTLRLAAEESDAYVLATTSRRTPAWAEDCLKRTFEKSGRCPVLVIASQANPPGSVEGILALSGIILVSAESVSMISEAVSAGKFVVAFIPGSPEGLKPKIREFLSQLERKKRLVSATADSLHGILMNVLNFSERRETSEFSFSPQCAVLHQAAERLVR